jgi:hypothetical protein
MKTTLIIDDTVMARVKREAAERKCTMSELVESAVRRFLDAPKAPGKLPPLPAFRMGDARVDIADRDALHEFMEQG